MSDPDRHLPEEIRWRGRFIEARQRGRWEYVGRARNIRAAAILALDGSDGERAVILVEQYRVPLGRACLELPAGLIGDEIEGEDAETSAARELEEETGYQAGTIEALGEFVSSPGLVSESFTLVRATGLTRVGDGGGVAHEEIVVHRVPVRDIAAFVEAKRADGLAVDVKLFLLLGSGFLG